LPDHRGEWRLNHPFLDALYVSGKLTADARQALLTGANPTGFGLSEYDLATLTYRTCERLRGQESGPSSRQRPGASALNSVQVSTASTPLLLANPARLGFIVKNDGGQTLYLAYAPTASVSAYTEDLEPGAVFTDTTGWAGAVSACTASDSTTARTTEFTS
jgi:hypothetical protein